jgi:hypothetical protein
MAISVAVAAASASCRVTTVPANAAPTSVSEDDVADAVGRDGALQAELDRLRSENKLMKRKLKCADDQSKFELASIVGTALNRDLYTVAHNNQQATKTTESIATHLQEHHGKSHSPALKVLVANIVASTGNSPSPESKDQKKALSTAVIDDLASIRSLHCPNPLRTAGSLIVYKRTASTTALHALSALPGGPSVATVVKLDQEKRPELQLPAGAEHCDSFVVMDNNTKRVKTYINRDGGKQQVELEDILFKKENNYIIFTICLFFFFYFLFLYLFFYLFVN